MTDLSIEFTNFSTTSFQLVSDQYELALASSVSQLPGQNLDAMDGNQIMAVTNQTFAGEGAAIFCCVWFDPISGAMFGVQIVDGGQPFGIGPQPTWNYCYAVVPGSTSPPITWISVDNPASQVNWPTGFPFLINATPTSTHETLSIVVFVQSQS